MSRRYGSAAALAAIILVATSCGSDSETQTTSADTGASTAATAAATDTSATDSAATTAAQSSDTTPTAARGVTDDTILIGAVTSAASWPDMEVGVNARFNRENQAGGIFGRQLKLAGSPEDDGGDPSKTLSIVQSLVQRDNVFGIIETSGVFEPQVTDFLVENHVPYYGWGFEPGFCSSEWGYGFNGCTTPTPPAQPATGSSALVDPIAAEVTRLTGKPASEQRWATQAQDNVGGKAAQDLFNKLVPARGLTVSYNEANIPSGQGTVDYTPYVQAIIDSKPDSIFVGTDFPTAIAFTAALKAAGYEGVIYNSVGYVPGLLAAQPNLAAALDGTYVPSQIPAQEEQSAAIKQFEADLTAIDQPPVITFGAALGYWNADVLIQMLKATGENLSPDALKEVVNGGSFAYEPALEGGIGPMKFPEAEVQQTPCAVFVQVSGTDYKVVEPFKCYETVDLS